MKRLITHVPCTKCSFMKVVEVINANSSEINLVPVIFSVGKVNISDAVWFLRSFKHHAERNDLVIWLDTPLELDRKVPDYKSRIYVSSQWNAEMLISHGIHVDGIVPKPINDGVAVKYANAEKVKDIDFIMIGGNIRVKDTRWFKNVPYIYVDNGDVVYDRKGVKLFRVLPGKKVLVSDDSFADYKLYSLSEEEKYDLLARSRFYLALSHGEGFGIPPVEAMSVGTVPIFNECHAYKDWLVGLSVKCQGFDIIDTPVGKFRYWYYDDKEVVEVVKYALGMGKEEYEDLRQKVLNHSRQFYVNEVVKKLGLS
ncbi:putative glycosyltransferase [Sulfolobales Beppu filamentous virus 2]|uniref:Putative glycosyltransferase n=1 Tax=Sulfolobales Beppu filamentous virus 2 TaxID=2493123 RepID=A0A3Q8Q3S6_9VIRU|nr:glycosyltransferase [Sulfolobales Beppu filamentous virus 2]AZI75814.1 putative glycosyltransferase [Sulfolobales Beppu filamentous virus 2]